MSVIPLTVSEARAILIADKALVRLDEDTPRRVQLGALFGEEAVLAAWERIVDSAIDRVRAFEGARRCT